MADLVATCPKHFWNEWLHEGDCAGSDESGVDYYWNTASPLARKINVGDRLYIVAHGKLRGYAPVVRVEIGHDPGGRKGYSIVRRGKAVAVTLDEPVRGFPGLRKRWWDRSQERPFKNWWIP